MQRIPNRLESSMKSAFKRSGIKQRPLMFKKHRSECSSPYTKHQRNATSIVEVVLKGPVKDKIKDNIQHPPSLFDFDSFLKE